MGMTVPVIVAQKEVEMIAKLLHHCGQVVYTEHYELRGESLNTFRVDGEQVTICPNCDEPLIAETMSLAPESPAADLQVFANPFDADEFNVRYRCSACWGALIKVRTETRAWRCQCEECQDKTPGYVTARYVEKRFEQDRLDAHNARLALREAVPWMKSNLSEAEILAEIGF